jgi:hypothetical protein
MKYQELIWIGEILQGKRFEIEIIKKGVKIYNDINITEEFIRI